MDAERCKGKNVKEGKERRENCNKTGLKTHYLGYKLFPSMFTRKKQSTKVGGVSSKCRIHTPA